MYRGVFGSHVANVLRRLRRAAAIHGSAPRFLLASATIANPVELAQRLTGQEDFNLIDRDTAPGAARRIAMWNPPLLDEALGVRGSALYEAAEVFSELIAAGARTICFMKSRKGIELILRHAVDRLDPELGERIAPYRAGYTPAQRQDIQRRLTSGELLGVVATDALELGIDIGELDAAICVTFPGTVASLKQMWGRAGRRGRGLAVYIAGRGCARPVLLPAPRRVPAAAGRGGDPRPGQPRDLRRAPDLRRARGAAQRRRRAVPRRAVARARRGAGRGRLPARARDGLRPAPRRRLPGRARGAAIRVRRQLRPDRRELRRGARHGRGGPRVRHRARRRHLPAPRALLPRARARPRGTPRAAGTLQRRLLHTSQA